MIYTRRRHSTHTDSDSSRRPVADNLRRCWLTIAYQDYLPPNCVRKKVSSLAELPVTQYSQHAFEAIVEGREENKKEEEEGLKQRF